MHYQQHPLSAAFPSMSEAEYAALIDSITNIGVQNPITIFEGMVLDGWNRYRAATELGHECPEVLLGDVDPRDFVLAQNSARRNLTASQRALAAATCYQWKPVGNPLFGNISELPAQGAVAAAAKVSDRTLRHAKHVVDHGVDEVKEAVRSGAMPVDVAAEISRLPTEQQAAAVASPKTRKARIHGKPKKGPMADALRTALIAAAAKDEAAEAALKIAALETEVFALRDQLAEVQGDLAAAVRVLDASDQTAAALAEAKASRDMVRSLKDRQNSMQSQIADLTRQVKSWKKKAEATA
ncbi:ParB/RepB/Spo0J family partition protein [Variovorax sp. PBL-E5]|uniref:ParB/RepB/Spo0J family partition protein n=1 Tax=Variovorax sp. PBL-E5 TaxID=434014 RepID=UPI0013195096|nr:hypothetical protein [Variovorax sp. PBL-E5]VTU37093.1 hypothetical protein E5CHR_04483 [Variovorax sp. PBL-E5]